MRGWIALNLDTRFDAVRPAEDEEVFLEQAQEAFDAAQELMTTEADGETVIGLMMHGQNTDWSPPSGGNVPRLKTGVFQRWALHAEDPATEEFRFAERFFHDWYAEWDRNVSAIWSESYVWRL